MINHIKNNTISEADTKKRKKELNKIKKEEIKSKRYITSQKMLLKLLDDLLKTIYFVKKENNNNNNNNLSVNVSENENDSVSKNENESGDKTDDNFDTNNYFNIIDKTKSFKDQIEILKKMDDLSQYWDMNYYDDNKRLNFKTFKLNFAYISNDVDKQLFEKIFGGTYVALAHELLNTTSKRENQIFINNIKKNKGEIYEQDDSSNYIIQSTYKRTDLNNAINVILKFNEIIQSDLT